MGKEFKDRREKLGREIKEISQITRVKAAHLKAIEEDNFEKLPVEVYSRGYIREYARFLDISCEEILCRYEEYLERKKGVKGTKTKEPLDADGCEKQPAPSVSVTPPVPEPSTGKKTDRAPITVHGQSNYDIVMSSGRKGFMPRKIFWLIPAFFFLLIIYFYLPGKEPPAQQVVPPPQPVPAAQPPQQVSQPEPLQATSVPVVTPAVPAEKKPEVSSQALKEAAPQSAPKPPPQVKKKHSLKITATEMVWLHIVIDGVETSQMLLQAGEKRSYAADTSFALKIGNAGGINLNYDGREMNNLGEKGQVIVVDFPENQSRLPQAPAKIPVDRPAVPTPASGPPGN